MGTKIETTMEHQKEKGVAVIAIYSHIEGYPPSLNALYHLSTLYDEVYVLMRNMMVSKWHYPANVICITHDSFLTADEAIRLPLFDKFKRFVSFGLAFRRLVSEHGASLILTYDAAAFALLNLFCERISKKTVLWYHNHDVMHENELPRFSLMWLVRKLEIRYFYRITYFSLPSKLRLIYFPVDRLRNAPIILPNYPSKFFYGKWNATPPTAILRIVFQGHINKSNGIENFVAILPRLVDGKKLELHLAGPIDITFQDLLVKMASDLNVLDQLFFYGRIPYAQLPALTSSCHIGVAVYGEHNIMVRTMSTASNKLFEYASVGLPVIMNKRVDVESEFSGYTWIHFARMETASLVERLEEITANYSLYSTQAKNDFNESLNFENAFKQFNVLLR